MEVICNLCRITINKVYLTEIKLTSDDFKQILESARDARTFEMIKCKVTSLSKDFKLNDRFGF